MEKPDKPKDSSSEKKSPEVDEELNALLDSALEDFGKPLLPKPATTVSVPKMSNAVAQNDTPVPNNPKSKDGLTEQSFGPGFLNFEEAMRSFIDEDPSFKEQLEKLTEAANSGTGTDDEAFAASLAETLKGIAENAQSLSENPSEEELSKVLENLGIGGGQEGEASGLPNIIPLMQNVMQSLLSKELLYPALREIVDKYPDWLAEKRTSLQQDVYEKYNRQYELMKRVCDEFDAEQTNDSEQTKKSRFERVLQLMQKMQDCGHPPKELVGELGPDVPVDEDGNLKLPNLPGEQCSIM